MGKKARRRRSVTEEIEAREKVDPTALINSVQPDNVMTYRCTCCGKVVTKPSGLFPRTKSPLYAGNNNYAHMCWKCIFKYYESLLVFYKNDENAAANRICQIFDIYFSKNVYATVRYVNENSPRIKNYMSKLNQTQYNEKTSYLDTVIDSQRDVILDFDDLDNSDAQTDDIQRWGFGFTTEEYAYLNSELADWEARCVVEGKSRETFVKDACMLALQQNKALKEGKFDLYQKITDLRQKTLDKAELTPKVVISREKENEIPVGMMIERFERERPIAQPLPEWRDVDGIMKVVLVYFIGHLCRMLGLKNKYAKMYEDEMKKYTATVPELEDADADEVFDYFLNNGFVENGVTLTGGDVDEIDDNTAE